jgi:hypothetical protein
MSGKRPDNSVEYVNGADPEMIQSRVFELFQKNFNFIAAQESAPQTLVASNWRDFPRINMETYR